MTKCTHSGGFSTWHNCCKGLWPKTSVPFKTAPSWFSYWRDWNVCLFFSVSGELQKVLQSVSLSRGRGLNMGAPTPIVNSHEEFPSGSLYFRNTSKHWRAFCYTNASQARPHRRLQASRPHTRQEQCVCIMLVESDVRCGRLFFLLREPWYWTNTSSRLVVIENILSWIGMQKEYIYIYI